jgi:hypothetical protein
MRTARLRALAVFAAAAAVLVLSASVALAGIPALTERVTDETGVLDSDKAKVEQAVSQLEGDTGLRLWVLFVSTTGSMQAPDYAGAVFDATRLRSAEASAAPGAPRDRLRPVGGAVRPERAGPLAALAAYWPKISRSSKGAVTSSWS